MATKPVNGPGRKPWPVTRLRVEIAVKSDIFMDQKSRRETLAKMLHSIAEQVGRGVDAGLVFTEEDKSCGNWRGEVWQGAEK
jgi:hypothetical protein